MVYWLTWSLLCPWFCYLRTRPKPSVTSPILVVGVSASRPIVIATISMNKLYSTQMPLYRIRSSPEVGRQPCHRPFVNPTEFCQFPQIQIRPSPNYRVHPRNSLGRPHKPLGVFDYHRAAGTNFYRIKILNPESPDTEENIRNLIGNWIDIYYEVEFPTKAMALSTLHTFSNAPRYQRHFPEKTLLKDSQAIKDLEN